MIRSIFTVDLQQLGRQMVKKRNKIMLYWHQRCSAADDSCVSRLSDENHRRKRQDQVQTTSCTSNRTGALQRKCHRKLP